jgi:PTH2 family peptidyl-tRNA hydrolase
MNEDRNCKQVIVFRKDLLKGDHSLRKGKIAAQVAHASLGALLKWAERTGYLNHDGSDQYEITLSFRENSILDKWLNGIFTKICLMVENEEELLKLYERVKNESKIPCVLITDAGNTEFHGVPTNTCIGIGPWWSDEIDVFTKDLQLF